MKTKVLYGIAVLLLQMACTSREVQQSTQPQVQRQTQTAPSNFMQTKGQGANNANTADPQVNPAVVDMVASADSGDTTGKRIQVAILLDTSNSMDGLIDQAKSQLWKMVNELALARDEKGEIPLLELALYHYGNDGLASGTGYIQQIAPLTTDLDLISEKLFSLSTNGGNEYCGHVIQTASKELRWLSSNEHLKMIFIAGNEAFTQGEVDYKTSCRNAIAKGIIVNTIFCGDYQEGINTQWKDGADLTDGKYMNIDQGKSIVHIDAPQDAEINRLNQELNDTYIGYGHEGMSRKEMQNKQDMNAASFGSANNVQRAMSKASKAYKNDSWDLVDAVKEKKKSVAEIADDELPQEMKGMNAEQRTKYVEAKAAKRQEIQDKIGKLSEERRKYVAEKEAEMQKNDPNANTLDAVMLKAIREQAVKKKLRFEGKK